MRAPFPASAWAVITTHVPRAQRRPLRVDSCRFIGVDGWCDGRVSDAAKDPAAARARQRVARSKAPRERRRTPQASLRPASETPSGAALTRTPSFPACANCCRRWRAQTRDVELDDNGSCDRSPAGALAFAEPSISVAFTALDSLLMRRARRTAQTRAAWRRRSRGGQSKRSTCPG